MQVVKYYHSHFELYLALHSKISKTRSSILIAEQPARLMSVYPFAIFTYRFACLCSRQVIRMQPFTCCFPRYPDYLYRFTNYLPKHFGYLCFYMALQLVAGKFNLKAAVYFPDGIVVAQLFFKIAVHYGEPVFGAIAFYFAQDE
jgi:hypothetical protein